MWAISPLVKSKGYSMKIWALEDGIHYMIEGVSIKGKRNLMLMGQSQHCINLKDLTKLRDAGTISQAEFRYLLDTKVELYPIVERN